MRAIVAKGVHSPVPAYGPVAKEMIFVDSPGSTRADLSSLPYRNRDRPLYPLDKDKVRLGSSFGIAPPKLSPTHLAGDGHWKRVDELDQPGYS